MCEAVEKYGDMIEIETTANNVKNLMESMNITLEQALDALKISEESKALVIERLSETEE